MKVRNIVYWYNGKQFVTGNLLTTAMDICHVNLVILGGHTKENIQFGNSAYKICIQLYRVYVHLYLSLIQ